MVRKYANFNWQCKISAFLQGGIKGEVQSGTGWWFNNQKDSMI
ncbi:glucuronate isomerase [Parageobacillus thermoglucosidasius]